MTKLSYTVNEFCKAVNISRGRFHELQQAGLAPRIYRIASRPYITVEAANEWLKRMERGEAENFRPLPPKNPGRRGRVARSE